MSSSNDIQTNPGETSILAQANLPVQPTPETSTNPNTTNSNGSNNEVSKKNNVDNSPQPAEQHTPETNDNGNTATSTTSMCFRIPDFHLLKKKKKIPKVNLNEEEVAEDSIRGKKEEDNKRMSSQLEMLQKKLTQIKKNVDDLAKFHQSAESDLQRLQGLVEAFPNSEDSGKKEASTSKKPPAVRLAEINKEIMNLKKHLSSPETAFKAVSLSSTHLQSSTGSNGRSAVHELVNVHQRESFKDSSFYKEIHDIFNVLDYKRKFLLSCFTVFPENAVVKRRIFVYWGVGEKLWNDSDFEDDETPENIVDGILKEFQEKGLIEPAIKKRKLHVKSYKMNPIVRSAVTMLSQEAGNLFEYDDKGDVLPRRCRTSEGVEVSIRFPSCKRMCLLKDEEEDQEQKQKDLLEKKPSIPEESQSTSSLNSKLEKRTSIPDESQSTSSLNSEGADLGKLVTLFNVNEPFPDLELAWLMKKKAINEQKKKKAINEGQIKEPTAVDWLSKMKDAQVVCLGSWPGSVKAHVEVESIEFLEGLKKSTGLRFLSLQGVSGIKEIPEFIGNHSNLLILDLKECHNLEGLSKEIGKLTNLRYLDLSDCYLLARLPNELSALVQLRVLKGFVISHPRRKGSATLHDLKELKKLRKLTINANSMHFPTDEDLTALQNIGGKLQKLTIAWGATLADKQGEAQNGGNACWKIFKSATKQLNPKIVTKKLPEQLEKPDLHNPKTVTKKLPEQLEKLDLQCFPNSTATWLTPESLPELKKLYIRGGNLATLDRSKWLKVQALRLKYLRELKMNWGELKDSFPDLVYLEKVKCPGITLCPCDEHGVWMKNPDQIEQK